MTRTAVRDRAPRRPPAARYRRRRVAALLIGLLLLVGLGFCMRIALYDMGLFDVEGVQVTGTVTIPVDEVDTAASVTIGGPLAAVDTGGIADRVAQLPAVESVVVRRGWPHTVEIVVTERMPVATTGGLLVDRNGAVYRGVAGPELPNLTATAPSDEARAAVLRDAVAVLAAVPPELAAQVRTVDVNATGQVELGLTEERRIRWGSVERSADKAAVLRALLSQEGAIYDVTSPDLPTIRR